MNKIIFFICFLIISCDLPNEASADCWGISGGNAYTNNCGECVGGSTGREDNFAMNNCGQCYKENGECLGCGSSSAINYMIAADESLISWEGITSHDESTCIYDMCTDYFPPSLNSNDYDCDSSTSNSIYEIGAQLRCEDAEKVYSLCYPTGCNTTFKLADFYEKAIFIELTASW